MASSSDNQGLQIAVIIFALLTIIMSGATFYVFKLSEDAELRLAAAQKKSQEDNANLAQAVTELNELKQAINSNLAIDAKHDAVKAQITSDLTTYASTLPEEKRTYSAALLALSESLQLAQKERVEEGKKLNDMAKKLIELEAKNDEMTKEYLEKAETALAETKAVEQKSTEAQKKLGDTNKALATERQQALDEAAEAKAAFEKAVAKADDVAKKQQELLAKAGDEIKDLTDAEFSFEKADGEIAWVAPRSGTVWINRGRADGLRPQVSFSVYGMNQNGVARSEPKARIEVTEILGDHLAEARVVEDTYTDPVMVHDYIYTPLWQPNRAEHFAIAGKLDIDGDGANDVAFVRDLIKRNGGVLDAELRPDGTIEGEMTINTRYLIRGEPFEVAAAESNDAEMQRDARNVGAEVLSVQKFLDFIGWKDTSKVVQFGANSDPKDFQFNRNENRPTRRTPTNASQFRRREAPRSNNGSAFQRSPQQ